MGGIRAGTPLLSDEETGPSAVFRSPRRRGACCLAFNRVGLNAHVADKRWKIPQPYAGVDERVDARITGQAAFFSRTTWHSGGDKPLPAVSTGGVRLDVVRARERATLQPSSREGGTGSHSSSWGQWRPCPHHGFRKHRFRRTPEPRQVIATWMCGRPTRVRYVPPPRTSRKSSLLALPFPSPEDSSRTRIVIDWNRYPSTSLPHRSHTQDLGPSRRVLLSTVRRQNARCSPFCHHIPA